VSIKSKKHPIPLITVIKPSIIKIHLQPLSPPTPSICVIPAASSPENAPEIAAAE
jgi:hypothetical protein